ncbi:hypothetical protein [Nocardioides perillae]|uniref:Bacteriocin biosynthesis cyclodehydratase domain-containing protein n=1 Tax=Nocardioides perillae TaxID=1119534 RepID=A0A7Y9RVA5_9ACTN|nr:hypothetical protein [Nocardioides perillae]NYG55262.1 hypothetical protein [Nocardioides perillae]
MSSRRLDPGPVPSAPAAAGRDPDPVVWVLAPGVAVVRRPPDHVQVGTGDRAVVVGARDAVRGLLDRLGTSGAVRTPGRHDLVWRRLREERLVVPAASLRRDLTAAGGAVGAASEGGEPARAAVAAAYAVHGEAAPTLLARRRSLAVGVAGRADWCARVAPLLANAGLVPWTDPEPRRRTGGGAAPAAWVLLDRPEAADDLLRTATPHLHVVATPRGGARVGPFTAPGESACVRCLSAARADQDPAAPLVDLQLSRARATVRGDTVAPAPGDPTLVAVALGLAAADLLRWVDGRRPQTWSATVEVDDRLDLTPRRWPLHPRCGCDWAA